MERSMHLRRISTFFAQMRQTTPASGGIFFYKGSNLLAVWHAWRAPPSVVRQGVHDHFYSGPMLPELHFTSTPGQAGWRSSALGPSQARRLYAGQA
jgi:hypothetical protein